MKCKVLADFSMAGVKYKAGDSADFNAEQVARLPQYIKACKCSTKKDISTAKNKMVAKPRKKKAA